MAVVGFRISQLSMEEAARAGVEMGCDQWPEASFALSTEFRGVLVKPRVLGHTAAPPLFRLLGV